MRERGKLNQDWWLSVDLVNQHIHFSLLNLKFLEVIRYSDKPTEEITIVAQNMRIRPSETWTF